MAGNSYDAIWKEAWDKVKTYENINPHQIDAFFSRLQPQAFSPGFLMITADNAWLKHWIETNYSMLIARALEEIHGVPFAVEIEVDHFAAEANNTSQTSPESAIVSEPVEQPHIQQPPIQQMPSLEANKASLNNDEEQTQDYLSAYTFDNFVVGVSNRVAYSIALSIAEEPGQSMMNPFFIYGKSGLGKTHLLCAIKNYVMKANPKARTIYVEANEFLSDYTEASIASSKNPDSYTNFFTHYQTADLLLVDDVQNLQGKEGTLNALFTILNKMTNTGRQMVLSADRPPSTINFNERVKSRMNQGPTINIEPPEIETKIEIIRNFINDYRIQYPDQLFDISPEIQEYIAQVSGSNIRELKSAITVVIVNTLTRGQLSTQDVSMLLQNHFSSGATKKISIEDIQKAVEDYYGITHEQLIGKNRSAHFARARHMAMYLCRTMIDIPFQTIADNFGGKNHTTVLTAYKNIVEKSKDDIDTIGDIENLKKRISEM